MGWAVGYDTNWGRWIGYGVPAICDYPGCGKSIDRGLGYVCGFGEPHGGDEGCGLFFCTEHGGAMLCERCGDNPAGTEGFNPFEKTADTREWIEHMLEDESWAQWRAENPAWAAFLREGT